MCRLCVCVCERAPSSMALQPTVPAGVVVPGQTAGPLWLTDLCGGCNGETCCVGCCCPCCMVGANAKMVQTGVLVDPCSGTGPECCIHGMLGGFIQGVAIFIMGPLAALIHLGSCYACGIRSQLRTKVRRRRVPRHTLPPHPGRVLIWAGG